MFPTTRTSRVPRHYRLGALAQALLSLAAAGALTLLGAWGYHVLESWSWSDSFYMVFITLSTVGFSEVHPLSPAGRLWTIFLVVGGVSIVGFMVTRSIEFFTDAGLVEGRRVRKMNKIIDKLRGHYVVCGFGRVGQQVVENFEAAGVQVVVIDREDRDNRLEALQIPFVLGNAEDESALIRAGIDRASGLVACVDSDTENVFITLTARQLNPQIRVIGRASNEETARKLTLVGAERVVSPYVASGRRMAHLALRPHAVDFFDTVSNPLEGLEVEIHEIEIAPASHLAGHSLKDSDMRRKTGVIVVAVRRGDRIELNPSAELVLEAGAHLIAMGTPDQIARLDELNRPGEA